MTRFQTLLPLRGCSPSKQSGNLRSGKCGGPAEVIGFLPRILQPKHGQTSKSRSLTQETSGEAPKQIQSKFKSISPTKACQARSPSHLSSSNSTYLQCSVCFLFIFHLQDSNVLSPAGVPICDLAFHASKFQQDPDAPLQMQHQMTSQHATILCITAILVQEEVAVPQRTYATEESECTLVSPAATKIQITDQNLSIACEGRSCQRPSAENKMIWVLSLGEGLRLTFSALSDTTKK